MRVPVNEHLFTFHIASRHWPSSRETHNIDWSNVDLMLGQRRGRWPSIEPTLPLVSWVGWISFKTLHSSFKQEIYPYKFLDSSNDPAQSTAPQKVYCMTLEITCHSSLYFSNNFQGFFQQRKIWIPKTLCSIKGGLGTFHLILFLYRIDINI